MDAPLANSSRTSALMPVPSVSSPKAFTPSAYPVSVTGWPTVPLAAFAATPTVFVPTPAADTLDAS